MGWECPPFYGKSKEFYVNKIAKNTSKIEKLQKEIDFCQQQLDNEK